MTGFKEIDGEYRLQVDTVRNYDVFHEEKNVDSSTNTVGNLITINCFFCHTEFELNLNIPSSEKTFYCKCINCGAELKRGNPNYDPEFSETR